jgi:hypothetical protein
MMGKFFIHDSNENGTGNGLAAKIDFLQNNIR